MNDNNENRAAEAPDPGELIANLSEFTERSIRDHADFTQDVERLSFGGTSRKQGKIIRKEIYDTIDARVRNAVKSAIATTRAAESLATQLDPIEDLWIHEDMALDETAAVVGLKRKDLQAAYVGAREDLAIWKRRALEAEESCRRMTAAFNAENGPTRMGEPTLATQAGSAEPAAWIRGSGQQLLRQGDHAVVFPSAGCSNHSTPLYDHAPVPPIAAPAVQELKSNSVDGQNSSEVVSKLRIEVLDRGTGFWPIAVIDEHNDTVARFSYNTDAERFIASPSVQAVSSGEDEDGEAEWRRLALQFDGHRMQALGHLRAMLQDPAKHAPIVEQFLGAPPLSGEAALAQRIAQLAGAISSDAGERERLLREALQAMLDEKCDYMIRNKLGNPEIETTNILARAALAPHAGAQTAHLDDIAVDRFAAAMKAKLAVSRAKGRGGWDDPKQCTVERLAWLLVEHVEKGDPVDIANLAMMIHQRDGTAIDVYEALAVFLNKRQFGNKAPASAQDQVVRDKALEDAARVCEAQNDTDWPTPLGCAKAIRTLRQPPSTSGGAA